MSNESPLIKTLDSGFMTAMSMDFISAGYAGLVMKNGRVVRQLAPGRYFNFSLPIFDRCQLILVDTKLRNLDVTSNGDFLSQDQFLINVSLTVMYQVSDPKRVAVEVSDPISALSSAIKDDLGIVVGQSSLQKLLSEGRSLIRHYLIHYSSAQALGFTLEDARVSDISFPQNRGVIRQVEGMSAREEESHAASLKVQIAEARRPVIPPAIAPAAPIQQVHIIANHPSGSNPALSPTVETTAYLIEPGESQKSLSPGLAPTVLQDNISPATAYLSDPTGAIVELNATLTIGRELDNSLVVQDSVCSRYHAKIVNNGEQYHIIDIGSSNGTYINGQRLIPHQPVTLNSGMILKIGKQEWVFNS